MTVRLRITILLLAVSPVFSHQVDEYIQSTVLSIEKNEVQARMTLTPGIDVFSQVIALIDTDSNGLISEREGIAYAAAVLRDLSLKIDGYALTPQLLSVQFSPLDALKEGRGEIRVDFQADLPPVGRNRKLTLENRHQSKIAAYQVNSTVPTDPVIRIGEQIRNESQSTYTLEYIQGETR